jgi:hypothetical protein
MFISILYISRAATCPSSGELIVSIPHTPQLLFVLGGKEVGGLLVNILVLKEKNMEKQKEYNLCYVLAKVRTI